MAHSTARDLFKTAQTTQVRADSVPVVNIRRRASMAVAKVSEISATSAKSFEDAVQQGLTRAAKTLRNIRGAWVKEHQVRCDGARITEYQVNMMVTFVLDD